MTRATVDVIRKGGSHGALTETTRYSDLTAAYSQHRVEPQSGAFGEVAARLVEVFYIEPISGDLPAIEEGEVIRWDGEDYLVETATDLGGLDKRLRVETHRIRV